MTGWASSNTAGGRRSWQYYLDDSFEICVSKSLKSSSLLGIFSSLTHPVLTSFLLLYYSFIPSVVHASSLPKCYFRRRSQSKTPDSVAAIIRIPFRGLMLFLSPSALSSSFLHMPRSLLIWRVCPGFFCLEGSSLRSLHGWHLSFGHF